MSIIADIKQAKAEFNDHLAAHKCRSRADSLSAGEVPCARRIELWEAYTGTAGLWGKEPDDDQRQREHYERSLRPAAAL